MTNIVWCLPHKRAGRKWTIYCAILCVGKIQAGEIKKVFRANNRIDLCTIPELTNEYLVKVNSQQCTFVDPS